MLSLVGRRTTAHSRKPSICRWKPHLTDPPAVSPLKTWSIPRVSSKSPPGYPTIEIEALAERFSVSGRTIYNVLDRAGIARRNDVPEAPIRAPVHPWRPAPRRRRAAIAMSKAERPKLVDDFLAKNAVTKIPSGAMSTADVIHLDSFHD